MLAGTFYCKNDHVDQTLHCLKDVVGAEKLTQRTDDTSRDGGSSFNLSFILR